MKKLCSVMENIKRKKVCFIGCGAIGGYFGACFYAMEKFEVYWIARGKVKTGYLLLKRKKKKKNDVNGLY